MMSETIMAKVTAETITIEHVKAARELLRWRAADLASRAGLNAATVRRFESGGRAGTDTRKAMYDALIEAGAWFKNGGKPSVGLYHIGDRK